MAKRNNLIVLFLSGFLMIFYGLYNGYPMVTSDTGAYLESAFTLSVPSDRPITYSVFLLCTSMGISLWFPVFVQGALLAVLLYKLIEKIHGKTDPLEFMAITILIIGFTGVSWYVSQLMPDIFTAVLFLSTLNYLLYEEKGWKIFFLLMMMMSAMMHNSNLITLTCVTFLLILISYFQKKSIIIQRKKAVVTFALSILCWLIISGTNAIAGRGFRPSTYSHVFLMGKLVENGILKAYLDENCGKENYQLCAYKDDLPNVAYAFLWDPNSALYKTGGWDANREEYNKIIKQTLIKPKYLAMHAFKSAEATFRQLGHTNIGDGLGRHVENANPYYRIRDHYQHELKEYVASDQNQELLKFDWYNHLYLLVIFLSSALVLFIYSRSNNISTLQVCYILCILFLLANAFSTATFANVLSRLNSRLIWILPALNIIVLYHYYRKPKTDERNTMIE